MLIRTEGIVLKTQKYGEADLIITYLTADKGIIKAFAKSPRKIKSRFGSSLEPLTHSKISLLGKEHLMLKITQSDIINPFQQLRESFQDFINISKLVEIIISLMPEGIPNKKLFSFFLNILNFMESSGQKPKDTLYLIIQIRLLAIIGYAPRLKGCGRCGKKSFNFYPDSGTTLCNTCATTPVRIKETPIRITNKVINFYTHSLEWPIKIASRLKPSQKILSELSILLDKHLNYLLNKKLSSSEFLIVSASHT
jgi:DNA repair protein RecO (recombination protein O)